MPISPGRGVQGGPQGQVPDPALRGETAVERFNRRGRLGDARLKLGTAEGRLDLLKRRAQRRDCQAEWLASRAGLVDSVKVQIAEWEAHEAEGHPKAGKRLANLRDQLRALQPDVVNVTHGFQYAYTRYGTANVNFPSDDIRFIFCMTNTDADTLRDAVDACGDLALDEFNGSSYSSGNAALSGVAIAVDDTNDRAEVDATDPSPVSYGAGTRAIEGLLVIKWITNLSSSLPLHFLDFSSNPSPDGNPFSIVINAEGFIQFTG